MSKIIFVTSIRGNFILHNTDILTRDFTVDTRTLSKTLIRNHLNMGYYYLHRDKIYITIHDEAIELKAGYGGTLVMYDKGIRTDSEWHSFEYGSTTTVDRDFIYSSIGLSITKYDEGIILNDLKIPCNHLITVCDNIAYYDIDGLIHYHMDESYEGVISGIPSYNYHNNVGSNVIFSNEDVLYFVKGGVIIRDIRYNSFMTNPTSDYFTVNDSLYDSDFNYIFSMEGLGRGRYFNTFEVERILHVVVVINSKLIIMTVDPLVKDDYNYEPESVDYYERREENSMEHQEDEEQYYEEQYYEREERFNDT
jgi:hypothetical protein